MSKQGVNVSKNSTHVRCADSHPPLKMGNGWLHGGSCYQPNTDEADVLIGLDTGMQKTSQSWPWTKGVEFLYPISDMQAPVNPKSFDKLINWMVQQLEDGKRVHVGCIGGHGRTGTVIAAIVKVMLGEEDAIMWVRKHYCKKAVESAAQINFLNTYYGIKKVEPSKSFASYSSGKVKGKRGNRSYSGSSGISHDSYRRAGLEVGGYLEEVRKGTLVPLEYEPIVSQTSLSLGRTASKLSPIDGKRNVWQKPEGSVVKIAKAKKTVFKKKTS